jgi:hypothetical protein
MNVEPTGIGLLDNAPTLDFTEKEWDYWRIGYYTEAMKEKKRKYYCMCKAYYEKALEEDPENHIAQYELEDLLESPLGLRVQAESRGEDVRWE